MLAQFKERIQALKSADKGISDVENIARDVMASGLMAREKSSLLDDLGDVSFEKGIELSALYAQSLDEENDNLEGRSEADGLPSLSAAGAHGGSRKVGAVQSMSASVKADSFVRPVENGSNKSSLKIPDIFSGAAQGWLASYKRYYLFKIGNGSEEVPKTILVHDNIPAPELLLRAFSGFKEIISLDVFIQHLGDTESKIRKETHLCLLVLSDFSSKSYELIEKADLLKSFEVFRYYELVFEGERIRPYEYEGDRLLVDLCSDVHVSLTNAGLERSEEALIKSFFPAKPSLIQYKILKGGFSGSKVVEVCQAVSVHRPRKFVIKIGTRKAQKIAREEDAVKQWVSNLVSTYQTEKKENATHEALRYQFASIDGKRESTSFSQYFKENPSKNVRSIVEKLFGDELFSAWEEWQIRKEEPRSIGDLYRDYVDPGELQTLVRRIAFDKADWGQFERVLKAKVPCYVTKVCHGDLHSENIIIDDEKVFLIDFGMTSSSAHCFIDYATLEASIRFKLTPPYFPTSELARVDGHFLEEFDVTDASLAEKIENSDLRKSYEVISKIRQVAIQKVRANTNTYRSNDELELNYLIALFCISLRNIGFSDLNQKYGMSLCCQLGPRILTKLESLAGADSVARA
jgi:hypothetical protein